MKNSCSFKIIGKMFKFRLSSSATCWKKWELENEVVTEKHSTCWSLFLLSHSSSMFSLSSSSSILFVFPFRVSQSLPFSFSLFVPFTFPAISPVVFFYFSTWMFCYYFFVLFLSIYICCCNFLFFPFWYLEILAFASLDNLLPSEDFSPPIELLYPYFGLFVLCFFILLLLS